MSDVIPCTEEEKSSLWRSATEGDCPWSCLPLSYVSNCWSVRDSRHWKAARQHHSMLCCLVSSMPRLTLTSQFHVQRHFQHASRKWSVSST